MPFPLSPRLLEFYNRCHAKADGKFCDTAGGNRKGLSAAERAAASTKSRAALGKGGSVETKKPAAPAAKETKKSAPAAAKPAPAKPAAAKPPASSEFDSPEVQRGVNVKLTPEQFAEIAKLSKSPRNGAEYNQHFKIGEMLAKVVAEHVVQGEAVGLGRHWTSSKQMAETAALQGGKGGIPVRITAAGRKADIDHVPDARNNFSGEEETTFVKGSKFEIRNIEIRTPGGAWESVWDVKGEGQGQEALDRYNA